MKTTFEWLKYVDNFDEVLNKFNFNFDDNSFYLVQLMIRKKDINKTKFEWLVKWDNLQLKEFYITSKEDLLAKRELIIYLCNSTWARAYITPRRYHFENVSFEFIKNIWEQFSNRNFSSMKNKYISSIIKSKSLNKKRIIDIDNSDKNSFEYNYFNLYLKNNKIEFFELHTPHWFHLICEPFNLQIFNKEISKIENKTNKERIQEVSIHKNNSTILYSLVF